jgi:hypothetical protein
VERRAKGETITEASKAVNGDSRNSGRLESKPRIRHALAAMETKVLRGSLMSIAQRRDYVLDRLLAECECDKDAVRVRALELLGRTAGLWTESREEPVGGAEAIRERIQQLMDDVRSRTIEHVVDVGGAMELVPDAPALGESGLNEAEETPPIPHPPD